MKHKQVIKQLIKSLVISLAVIIVFVVLYYMVVGYKEEIEKNIQEKNSDLIASRNQYSLIDKRVSEANEAYKFYTEFTQSRESKAANFRRDSANKTLARIGQELSIEQLLLAMGQFKEVEGLYKKEDVSLYSADMSVQFTSFEDISAYNLLKKIEELFPGNVIIDKFRFQKEKFSESLLIELSEGKRLGLVTGDVSFRWRGIQENMKLSTPVSKTANKNSGAKQ